MVKVLKQGAVAGASVLLIGVLAACSEGAQNDAPQPNPDAQGGSVEIENPRNASAPELCDLLPAGAATSLGMGPDGEVDDSPSLSEDKPEACLWRSENGGKSVSLGPIEDRSIREYHDNKSTYSDYEELTVAGHPAVRANQGDPSQDGFCAMFLATDDRQLLYAHSHDVDTPNTCGLAQKALEASVPTLPAAAG
ncbi:DUF3558 family protein [Saccharopolyspora sp. HNM0983]|uniref:DUF3558 family protein n=1 Tax=Saccharopolyspora montiporae TaxID=2781240 RepID=A0A929BAW2_9PSEU|nr:DUF3558 family protein [Saccharopolyspora sp. HNM0983]MBE9376514.1 DUF3558 family protein [Saccharopolyspora sp. HNM0983]